MNEEQFVKAIEQEGLELNDLQLKQFHTYFEQLISWNEKVNLTAITEKEEVYLKHFYDSLTPSFYHSFHEVASICDIGAGAGFPSIPLKISYPHLHVTIVDSLKKRIRFLEELVSELKLTDIQLIHARAEDFGQRKVNREKYDVVTARAVANMAVLAEYCLPVTKIDGYFIALKGANSSQELANAENAIKTLGGQVEKNIELTLPIENSERSIIFVKKINKTPKKYPRKAGMPAKSPIK